MTTRGDDIHQGTYSLAGWEVIVEGGKLESNFLPEENNCSSVLTVTI